MTVQVSRARLRVAAVLLAAIAAGSGRAHAESPGPSPARQAASLLTALQARVLRIAGTGEPSAADVAALRRALVAVKGRPVADARIATLAASIATAAAQATFDEDTAERLAHNLYAAVHNASLTGREASLLVLDVSMLLTEAGADQRAVNAAIAALAAICPEGTDQVDTAVARVARPPTLTRRSTPSP